MYGVDRRDWDIGFLWLKLLAYYTLEHDCEKVVKIEWDDRTEEDIQFNKKRIAVRGKNC